MYFVRWGLCFLEQYTNRGLVPIKFQKEKRRKEKGKKNQKEKDFDFCFFESRNKTFV